MINIFEEVYFDRLFKEELCYLAIREKWIDKYSSGFPLTAKEFSMKRRINYKRKILLYLVLFKHVNGRVSHYDLNKFVSEGLIKSDSNIVTHIRTIPSWDIETTKLSDSDKYLVNSILNTSKLIIQSNSKKLANRYSKESLYYFAPNNKVKKLYSELLPPIEEVQEMINYILTGKGHDKWKTPFSYYIQERTLFFLDEMVESLFLSSKNKIVSINSIGSLQKKKKSIKSIKENLEYIININFVREANIFPYPENFDDVLRFRESKDIERFREVISNWISSIKEGNEKTIYKVKKDLINANKQLKRLTKWKEYKESQINFYVNSIGGHIPILSNVLTIIYTFDHLISKQIEQKNNWILINR